MVGLKDPQEPAGVQLQSTPAASFVVALTEAPAPSAMLLGGSWEIETEIAGPLMVTLEWAFLVASLTEVAVMVTAPPDGTDAGEL